MIQDGRFAESWPVVTIGYFRQREQVFVHKLLTVTGARVSDSGPYFCVATDHQFPSDPAQFFVRVHGRPGLGLASAFKSISTLLFSQRDRSIT